ncbi:ROT1-like protein [Aureobasidium pullulans]|uniref:Protein ROT1 n=2 Tax=Aureobasidium pullulans TaxID=5580 RepID=A0A074Y4G4_AURPU|nr:ROT1-like protein [Aureobasidium pullulans EXF-150]THW57229.1 ROT1-like protein [Aureobasidium pullulans]KEQ81806.1 ROT1-like protein [Aureobasidium pullulans EXF-150]THW68967.1 ROT1-like protein [Aureobasidium pullulans]THX26498.1 ROT1-like protein [Aureobasidium pullulans]THX68305.1 ROT1-like protein [Aureobasidium pullulans]
MRLPSAYALTATLAFASVGSAQVVDADLVGTWATKANKTLTGPGFYDPVGDNMIEPSRPGISYSFTSDGFYEEAYYRAISNPANPSCPGAIMQWQHGSYVIGSDGSLTMTPIAVDGRQLLSQPCQNKNSIYTRYNTTEKMKAYRVYTDPYHGVARLDLTEFDGKIMQPMYLVYSPPTMLPTQTLNPTLAAGATSTSKAKRDVPREVPSNFKMGVQSQVMNPDRWWWMGLTFTGIGGLLYFGPRRMGMQL